MELKSRDNWQRLPFSGDYDMHDLVTFGGAGKPATVPSQSVREQKIIDAIDEAVAEADPARPFDEVEGRVVRHGPQVNFPACALSSPNKMERERARSVGLVEAVARPGEFPKAICESGEVGDRCRCCCTGELVPEPGRGNQIHVEPNGGKLRIRGRRQWLRSFSKSAGRLSRTTAPFAAT